jgi:uncharacterized damage-inducible protein DinB
MSKTTHQDLLEPLIDSYNRNNTILLNLLSVLPEGGLEAKAMEGSPSVAVMFSHVHQTRLGWLSLTAPEFGELSISLSSRRRKESSRV